MDQRNDMNAPASGLRIGYGVRHGVSAARMARRQGNVPRTRFATPGNDHVRGRAAASEDDR
jgi:hypothetical protein